MIGNIYADEASGGIVCEMPGKDVEEANICSSTPGHYTQLSAGMGECEPLPVEEETNVHADTRSSGAESTGEPSTEPAARRAVKREKVRMSTDEERASYTSLFIPGPVPREDQAQSNEARALLVI